MSLSLTSTAFTDGGEIPAMFTCDGEDISPPLSWDGVPAQAKSLALIIDDPDAPDPAAPQRVWVHWVVYNLPATNSGLKQAADKQGSLPTGVKHGNNDWGRWAYGGPCPPIGRHRYFHKLYALDVELPDLNSPTKAQLEEAMQGHIIDSAQLIGTYER